MKSLSQPFEKILITTVNNGPFFIGELFQRKFAHPAPDHGFSVICFYRKDWDHFIPVGYINFLPHEEVILVGGGMTDGRAFGHMRGDLAEKIRGAGGVLYHLLKFGFEEYKDQCDAFFGHAGDRRAYEVDMLAGFEPTKYQHLIAHFHKPLTAERKAFLIDKIHAIGPF
jgi:hypothetical protein